jgi:hypothetical protein
MTRPALAMTRLALGLLALLAALGAADPAAGELTLPSTPLALFDGGALDLRTLQGQVVVIRFLASW